MNDRPVGMFDSGVGGLSVLKSFQALAPNEDVIYFADTDWFPYGPRPAAELRKRAFAITQRLLQSGAKLIVVACNTASAAAIADLRAAFDVQFVGTVPGVKPAASQSKSGRVVILATEGTFDGDLYSRVVDDFARGTQVVALPGTGLAEIVESGLAGSERARHALQAMLDHEVRSGADTIVLGCTHYHFLASDIAALYPGLQIVDTTEAVARRAVQLLDESDQRNAAGHKGELSLIVSGDREQFNAAMERLGFEHKPQEAMA
ncbi:MAG: glutamate racemase [Dehalococcoidia bacterium]